MLRSFFDGIDEFLKAWYLTATVTSGILTAIVLAAPKVVVAGFYLLLLPGLFLAFMPTTFLWLLSFGGFWLVARNVMSSQLAITISVCLGGLILWGLPLGYQFNARNQLAPFAEKNVYPAQKIALAGDVELEYVDDAATPIQTNGPACGADCADLLFMNGVTSVTISRRITKTGLRGSQASEGSNTAGIAWTYNIVPKAKCKAPSAIIDLTGDVNSPEFGARQMRLASGFCIVASPSKGEPIDMMLTERQYKIKFPKSTPAKGGYWGLENAEVSSFKIVDVQNKVLLNEQVIKADTISAPLVLNSDGNPFRDIWFSWWRETINAHKRTGPAEADLNRGDIMARYSNLGQAQAADMSAQSFVPVLRAALDDPDKRSDQPAFRLTPMYFKQLSKTPPNDTDVALTANLIEDPRVKDFENLYAVLEPMGKRGDVLIGPLVARLTQAQNQGDKNLVSIFDSLLSGIGEGGYATLRPDVATILEN